MNTSSYSFQNHETQSTNIRKMVVIMGTPGAELNNISEMTKTQGTIRNSSPEKLKKIWWAWREGHKGEALNVRDWTHERTPSAKGQSKNSTPSWRTMGSFTQLPSENERAIERRKTSENEGRGKTAWGRALRMRKTKKTWTQPKRMEKQHNNKPTQHVMQKPLNQNQQQKNHQNKKVEQWHNGQQDPSSHSKPKKQKCSILNWPTEPRTTKETKPECWWQGPSRTETGGAASKNAGHSPQ